VGEYDRRLKIFVAAGTGLAPFVSIIRNCLLTAKTNVRECLSRFVVLHGASQPHELGYREDLQRVLNDAQTRYFPTVSRPEHASDWPGDKGRVETFFDDEKLEVLERRAGLETGGLNPERAVVYVCGLQETIANTLIHLLRRGYVPDDRRIRQALRLPMHLPSSLFFEQYDSDPIIDLNNEDFLQTLRATFPQGVPA
jgi:ferredoxin--NADP+ reductase